MKKAIEVEGEETAFKKVGSRYKLVKDFKGGPSHEEGGIPIVAEEGMVITPAKDRKKVLSMIDNRTGYVKDKSKFNTYRMTLPTDTDKENKAKRGVRYSGPQISSGKYSTANDFMFNLDNDPNVNINSRLREQNAIEDFSLDTKDVSTKPFLGNYTAKEWGESLGGVKDREAYQQWLADNNFEVGKSGVTNQKANYTPQDLDNIRNRYKEHQAKINNRDKTNVKKLDAPKLKSDEQRQKITPSLLPTENRPNLPVETTASNTSPLMKKPIFASKLTTPETKGVNKMKMTTFGEGEQSGGKSSNNYQGLTDNLGRIVPIAYDLLQGARPTERVTRRFLDPKLEGYQDLSEPLRQQVKTNTYGGTQVARNVGGGSGQNFRAMAAANQAQGLRDLSNIENTEAGRKIETQNRNLDRGNQAGMMNVQLGNQYDDIERRMRGARQGFTREAMTGIGALAKDMNQEKYLRGRDENAWAMDSMRLNGTDKFTDGQWELDTDKINKNIGRNPYRGMGAMPRTTGTFGADGEKVFKKGTQGIKVPKYKKGTRYKNC